MFDTVNITTEDNDFICENNREVRTVLKEFFSGDLMRNYSETFGKNGWGRINKGIYFRKYTENRTDKSYYQIAVQTNKFDNEYLFNHALKIIKRIVSENIEIEGRSWGDGNGTDLNIYGKGKATQFKYLQISVD